MGVLNMNQKNSISTAEHLTQALGNKNAQMYLRMLQQAEGTYKGADGNPYATAFGGGQLPDLRQHPRTLHSFTQTDGKSNKTSAAGAYQFLSSTWDDVSGKLGLQDFSPQSQDLAALELMRRNGSLPDVLAGNFDQAVKKDGKTWASLPSSPYAQPKRSKGFVERALNTVIPSAGAAELPAKTGSDARSVFEQAMQQYRAQPGGAQAQGAPKPGAPSVSPAPGMSVQPQSQPQQSAPTQQPTAAADPRAVFEQAMQQFKAKKEEAKPGMLEAGGMGVLRGAKDVIDTGAQWLASGFDKLAGTNEGNRVRQLNEAGKAEFDQRYGDSTPAGVGRFAGNVAATWPVGGVLGAGAKAAAGAGVAPKVLIPLGEALASGGMSAKGAGLTTRMAGGAITGGTSAALINPEDATTGAVVGAALPVAGRALGKLSDLVKGPQPSAQALNNVRKATDAGFVLPPSHARPTLANGLMEGVGGKTKTQQTASVRNQQTTNKLVKQALGIVDDVELTPQRFANMRKQAGQAYESLRGMGTVQTDKAFLDAVNDIGAQYANASRSFPGLVPDNGVDAIVKSLSVKNMDASSAVDAIHVLREQAKSAYSTGNGAAAKAANKAAQALEDVLERQLSQSGSKSAVNSFKEARQHIAKIYEAEKALHPGSGNIDARKLAASLRKGKPLSGEIRKVAEAADAFPKAFQGPEAVGSVAPFSVLDSAFAGGVGLTTGSMMPLAMLAARPGMRAAALSPMVQRGLSAAPSTLPLSVLAGKAAPLLYRAAPVAGANP